jgi:hypothetical protein
MTAYAQTVRRITAGEATGYGVTYTLPRTALTLTIEAECTETKAGVYAPYAERFLGVTDAPLEDATTWRITGVTLGTAAEADTTQTYYIRFTDKGNMPTFYLTDGGSLWSINREPEVVAGTSTDSEVLVSAPEALQVVTADLMKAGSKSKQAEIAAAQVFRIRESRLDLLTGESDSQPADGAAYQLVLENLQRQEAAYMSFFTGTQRVRRITRTFNVTPTEAMTDAVVLRFSTHYGFTDVQDLGGEPLYLSLRIVEDLRPAADAATAKNKKDSGLGVAYCRPGRAVVTLSYGGKTWAEREVSLAQLGSVQQLPATQFNKKQPAQATFNPITGAITLYEQQQ